MSARLHAFVQQTHDFNQVRRDRAIIHDVNRPPYPGGRIGHANVAKVNAAETRREFGTIPRRGASGSCASLRNAAAMTAA
jgi:hypothetical protein